MSTKYGNIRRLLYRLKRRYGVPVTWYHLTTAAIDIDTGQNLTTYLTDSVTRAIPLPRNLNRNFSYDLSYIAANKNFTYGAMFDAADLKLVLDVKDTTLGLRPTVNDQLAVGADRYEIKDILSWTEGKVMTLALFKVEVDAEIIGSNMAIAPDIMTGLSGGDTINVGDLVFQNGNSLWLATNADVGKPALGIVTQKIESTFYHQRHVVVSSITIAGTPDPDYKDIYLGIAGSFTFDPPVDGLRQKVGYATTQNGDGTWEAVINITNNVLFV